MESPQNMEISSQVEHSLSDKWVLWAHLPHDTDWSLKSYTNLLEISTVEEITTLFNSIPDKMTKNCMLFLMRKGIRPTWEDPSNANGGSFSYKVSNKFVPDVWKKLFYLVCGETICTDTELCKYVNGITISPKKNFCIIKINLKRV